MKSIIPQKIMLFITILSAWQNDHVNKVPEPVKQFGKIGNYQETSRITIRQQGRVK
jgi:hypothetical protein